MNTLINFVILLAALAILLGILWFILQKFPLPPPLNEWVNIVIVVIGGVFLIWLLLSMSQGGLPRFLN